jgi:hypothetical protein
MPELKNPRWEKFAHFYVLLGTQAKLIGALNTKRKMLMSF